MSTVAKKRGAGSREQGAKKRPPAVVKAVKAADRDRTNDFVTTPLGKKLLKLRSLNLLTPEELDQVRERNKTLSIRVGSGTIYAPGAIAAWCSGEGIFAGRAPRSGNGENARTGQGMFARGPETIAIGKQRTQRSDSSSVSSVAKKTSASTALLAPSQEAYEMALPFSAAERKTRDRLAKQVRAGMDSVREGFVAVGDGLGGILEGRLYRGTHPLFEAFTEAEFGIQRAHAHRLVNAAARFKTIAPVAEKKGLPVPQNEAQLRPLAKLDNKEAVEVWTLAAKRATKEQTPLTAELVAEEVYRFVTPTDEIERDTARRRDRRVAAAQKADDWRADAQTVRPTPVETPVQSSVASEPKPALRIPAPDDSDAAFTFRGDCCELREFVRGIARAWPDHGQRLLLIRLLEELGREIRLDAPPARVDQIIATF